GHHRGNPFCSRAFRDADRRHLAGEILLRRSALRAGRAADARASDATTDAQSHASAGKQFIALSIHSFGDGPLGWRYPGVLFGSLAIVAVYLSGLALFAAQGPAIAASLLAFFNQMLFVQSRIAMLDIFALTFSLFAIAAFMHGFRKPRPHLWFALAGIGFGLSIGC